MLSEITQTKKGECINNLYMKPKKYNTPVNTIKKKVVDSQIQRTN